MSKITVSEDMLYAARNGDNEAMNELVRTFAPVVERTAAAYVGRCPLTHGDLIQEGVKIPKPERGDTIAVLTTGAYNFAMSSNYNAICKPPVIMLDSEKDYVAVKRETFDDLIARQV